MFILLNGAFGIGKTTAARALVATLPSSSLYDPEPLGIAIQRLSAWAGPSGRIEDFQDVASWRRLTAWAARWRHRRFATVIVPMAFTNLMYFEELAERLRPASPVQRLCLVAPLAVVHDRLAKRAHDAGRPPDAWAIRRAEECCRAHQSPAFGEPIDATAPVQRIVDTVIARVREV